MAGLPRRLCRTWDVHIACRSGDAPRQASLAEPQVRQGCPCISRQAGMAQPQLVEGVALLCDRPAWSSHIPCRLLCDRLAQQKKVPCRGPPALLQAGATQLHWAMSLHPVGLCVGVLITMRCQRAHLHADLEPTAGCCCCWRCVRGACRQPPPPQRLQACACRHHPVHDGG